MRQVFPPSFCLATLGALLCLSLFGQGSLDIERWDMDRGLTDREVRFVTRGPDGFIWTVTSELGRFDGHEWIYFSPFDEERYFPLADIGAVSRLGDSALIVGKGSQLFAFDLVDWSSRPLPLPGGMKEDFTRIAAIHEISSNGQLLFITQTGSSRSVYWVDDNWCVIAQATLPHIVPLLQFYRLYHISQEGIIWTMDRRNRMLRGYSLAGEEKKSFGDVPPVEAILSSMEHFPFLLDRAGHLLHWEEGAEQWVVWAEIPIKGERVIGSHINNDGQLWIFFATYSVEVNPKEASVRVVQQSICGTFDCRIRQIFGDGDGDTWYATNRGLTRIGESLNPFITALVAKEGETPIQCREIIGRGEHSVLVRILKEGNELQEVDFLESGDEYRTTRVFRKEQTLGRYFILKDQVLRLGQNHSADWANLLTGQVRQADLPKTAFSAMYPPSFTRKNELHYLDEDKAITAYNLENKSHRRVHLVGSDYQYSLQERFLETHHGYYVLGGLKDGLVLHDTTDGKQWRHFTPEQYPQMSSAKANCILFPSLDRLWVGTLGGGLMRIDPRNESIKTYTRADGLPNNNIASLTEDAMGNIWVATYYGLSRFDPEKETFENYFQEDGLPHNEFNYLSNYRDSAGLIYLGTVNGMIRFNPRRLIQNEELPTVSITKVEVYNRRSKQYRRQNNQLTELKHITLGPFDNNLRIQFGLPAYGLRGKHRYRVKIFGLEEDWQDLRGDYAVQYRQFPPGKYRLGVKAVGPGGEEGRIRYLAIHALRPIYQRWWFLFGVVMMASVLVYAFYRYRMKLLHKEVETRIRIARDLHDEIGSSLTRVSMQLELMATRKSAEPDRGVGKINGVVKGSIEKLRDLVWSVDQSTDPWGDVLDRMEDYAHGTLGPRGISFSLSQVALDMEKSVGPYEKRNLYLIFKEAIHNVAKHAAATSVRVELGNENMRFFMRILDNGSGIEPHKGQGYGLKNMRLRAEKISGDIRFDKTGEGFVVEVRLNRRL